MNERVQHKCITLIDADDGNAVGVLEGYFTAMTNMRIVGISAAPFIDAVGATLDVDDDGANVIAALACAVAAVPGTWKSTFIGGVETPVVIAKDSLVSFDINSGGAATSYYVHLYYVIDEA
jgi:hypothetical protein